MRNQENIDVPVDMTHPLLIELAGKIDELKLSAKGPEDIGTWFMKERELITAVARHLKPGPLTSGSITDSECDSMRYSLAMSTLKLLEQPCADGYLTTYVNGPLDLEMVMALSCWGGILQYRTPDNEGRSDHRIILTASEWPFAARMVLYRYASDTNTETHVEPAKQLLSRYYPRMPWDLFYMLCGSGIGENSVDSFLTWLEPFAAGATGVLPGGLELPDLSTPGA
jgi:hypothetical protein